VRLIPELSAQFPHLAQSAPSEPGSEKRYLHRALKDFFVQLAIPTLLLIIEDAHWCDDASLDFLLYLARYIPTQPICLLLSYRSDEITPALARFIAELERERLLAELDLAPLALHETDAMIRAILDAQRSPRFDLVEAIHNLSEGNPFFVEEIVKTLAVDL